MKILYLTLENRGGMIHYVSELTNAISKNQKIEPILITGNINNQLQKKIKTYKYSLKILDTPVTLINLFMRLNKFKPDIIHITSPHHFIFILMFLKKKYPLVVTLHDVVPHEGEKSWIKDLILNTLIRSSEHIFVHGEMLRKQLIQKGYLPKRITVIPHGDYSFFREYNQNINEENTILFFGRIHEYKGLRYLIKSAPLIREQFPDVKIIIAGRGEFSQYEKLIINEKNFKIINEFIPENEVAELFQKCKLVVLPYLEASQSGVIPIAYAFKKPVVATHVGAIPEIVDNGITGLLVKPKDHEALAKAIIKLLKNDHLRKEMGENAYKKMKEDLSWDKIAEKTINIYETIFDLKDEKELND